MSDRDRDRDRDAAGRPENARPRDPVTGRPLPRPTGRERLRESDERAALPGREALDVADGMIRDGRPFYAHEVLEGPWHLAAAPERAFWQGLAQVAVGLTHAQRGNAVGATSLLRSGAEKLDGYPDGHEGVAVRRLAAAARALADRIDRDGVGSLTAADLALPLRP